MELFRLREIKDKEKLQNIDALVERIKRELNVADDEAKRIARDRINSAYDAGLVKAEEELGQSFGKDVATLDQLKKTNFNLITDFTDTQKKNMERILRDGVMNGQGSYKIANRISSEFKTTTARARTIARTEVVRASNFARLDGWKQSNVVKKKEWSAFIGDRTCPTCVGLDGQTVSIQKKFNGQWQGETILKQMPPAHPNCYPKGTEVLTENGWKEFPEIDDERIWSLNPETMEMELSDYNKFISYEFDGELIKFSNKWFELTVTPDHRMAWVHPYYGDNTIEIRKAKNMKEQTRIPKTADWNGENKEEIEINGKKFDTNIFMKFLGWYLSEGHTHKGERGPVRIFINQSNGKWRDRIENILSKITDGNVNKSNKNLSIWDEKLGHYLEKLGKSENKYIPKELKKLDSKYLRLFLDEFIKGDGSITKKREDSWGKKEKRRYYTSSKKLASDLGELILKVGKYPSYRINKEKGEIKEMPDGNKWERNNDLIQINECDTKYITKKNIETIDYNGMVYDVELEKNHILYVRQNGSCCWSGNCRCSAIPIIESSSNIDVDALMLGNWDDEDFPTTEQIERGYGHDLVETYTKAKNRIREIIINNLQ